MNPWPNDVVPSHLDNSSMLLLQDSMQIPVYDNSLFHVANVWAPNTSPSAGASIAVHPDWSPKQFSDIVLFEPPGFPVAATDSSLAISVVAEGLPVQRRVYLYADDVGLPGNQYFGMKYIGSQLTDGAGETTFTGLSYGVTYTALSLDTDGGFDPAIKGGLRPEEPVLPAFTGLSLSVASGEDVAPTSVVITTNDVDQFLPIEVVVGSVKATTVYRLSPTQISAELQPQAAGVYDVVVTQGSRTVTASAAFEHTLTSPTVTGIEPAAAHAEGGRPVTITGTKFDPLMTVNVTIGGVQATDVVYVDNETITAVVPAGAVGSQDVVLSQNAGVKTSTLVGGFEYVAPTITSLTPNVIPAAGGDTIVVEGTYLYDVTGITVDSVAVTFAVDKYGVMTFTAPAGTADTSVDVVISMGTATTATAVGGLSYISLTVTPITDWTSIGNSTEFTVTGSDLVLSVYSSSSEGGNLVATPAFDGSVLTGAGSGTLITSFDRSYSGSYWDSDFTDAEFSLYWFINTTNSGDISYGASSWQYGQPDRSTTNPAYLLIDHRWYYTQPPRLRYAIANATPTELVVFTEVNPGTVAEDSGPVPVSIEFSKTATDTVLCDMYIDGVHRYTASITHADFATTTFADGLLLAHMHNYAQNASVTVANPEFAVLG